jgi:hypothetical protein
MAATIEITSLFRLIERREAAGASDAELKNLWARYEGMVTPLDFEAPLEEPPVEPVELSVIEPVEDVAVEPVELPVGPVELPVGPVEVPVEPVKVKRNNFICKDFQKMFADGFLPVGTRFVCHRKGEQYKATVQIQTHPGGLTTPLIVSESDTSLNWAGGVFNNPSPFVLKAYQNITAVNPKPRKAVDGWTAIFIGSLEGPQLQQVRDAWIAGDLNRARELLQ